MGVSSDMRSSRVRRQAAKKPNKERTVQVRFSDEELAALDAICSEKKMTRSAFLRSCVEKVQGGDVEPTYVVTRNADAERMASEAKSIGVNSFRTLFCSCCPMSPRPSGNLSISGRRRGSRPPRREGSSLVENPRNARQNTSICVMNGERDAFPHALRRVSWVSHIEPS